jgi:hypothetical protein
MPYLPDLMPYFPLLYQLALLCAMTQKRTPFTGE